LIIYVLQVYELSTRESVLSLHKISSIRGTSQANRSKSKKVIEENVNPIVVAERATLVLAATAHGKPVRELLRPPVLKKLLAGSADETAGADPGSIVRADANAAGDDSVQADGDEARRLLALEA